MDDVRKSVGEYWCDRGTKLPWCVMGPNGKVVRYKLKKQAKERAEYFLQVRYNLHG